LRLLAPRADFAYGNARLRARKAGLIGRGAYEEMIGKDMDGILGALSRTPLAPEVESAITRFGDDARRLHEAVRLHLARTLEEMRSFYAGRARECVELLLSRWDLHNVLTLIRGEATAPHTEEALAHVFPMGAMNDAYAREIARQNEFAAAVGLMIRWRLPDPQTASSLRAAWPDYERTEDLAALEQAVTAAWAERTSEALDGLGREGEPLRRLFERETDEKNLLVALRLREALARGETDRLPILKGHGVYLPGGSIKLSRLDEAIRLPDDERVAATLAGAGPAAWREPLERWARGGRLPDLQYDLEARRLRDAVALFVKGDPLSVDVPIAYASAKETEARNLRLIAEGASRGIAPGRVRERLIFFDYEGGNR
jgi:V/A-type H+-transporting ATPase subunit C